MAKTALGLSPEEWKQYSLPQWVVTPELQARWDKAWKLIPELAKLLRQEYGANQIKVFGSATKIDYFSLESDIDLAVWGIPVDKIDLAIQRAFNAWQNFQETGNEFSLDSVALSLQSAYNGLEVIFDLIAREVDGISPKEVTGIRYS